MIDQTERMLAQAIRDTDRECLRVRATPTPQAQIDAADLAWVAANEAYAAAGYHLEAFETLMGRPR